MSEVAEQIAKDCGGRLIYDDFGNPEVVMPIEWWATREFLEKILREDSFKGIIQTNSLGDPSRLVLMFN